MILLLYSGSNKEYELNRIFEEAKRFSNLKLLNVENLTFPFQDEYFKDIKVFYFIGNTRKIGRINLEILADYLKKRNVRIVNRAIENYNIMNKTYFYYKMINNNIRVPKIIKIINKEHYKKVLEIGFPLIAKFDYIHLGKGVYLIENEQELKSFIEHNESKLNHIIFQEYIPYEKDVRIISIGEPIGGMERVNPNSFKANIAQGGYGRPYKIDKEIEEIAKKLSEIFNIEIFAFDVLIRGNVKYVIDLHIIFRFEGFEKYTGTNIARKILEYLDEVHSKS